MARVFLLCAVAGLGILPLMGADPQPPKATPVEGDPFRVWAFGDAHVGTDLRVGKRESLADALRASEEGGKEGGPPFEWDLGLEIGDNSGGQSVPEDDEGREVVRQYSVLGKHRREQIYDICGNHDRSHLSQPEAWWFRKWVDPMGENTGFSGVDPKRRPWPIEGTWERYSFRVGNLLFLMMSDINEPSQKLGRGDLGGNPGGVVREETFAWWKRSVEANPGSIIVSVHHYVLKDTTVASGEWEGMKKGADGKWKGAYHGYFEQGSPKGASYLYLVGGRPDAQAFEGYLAEHPGAVALWLGGHTHTHPDDTHGGKSHLETKWGVHFLNVACLTRYHGGRSVPKSRLLTFREGSDEVRVQCYMHTGDFLPQGWYDQAQRTLKLPRAFRRGAGP